MLPRAAGRQLILTFQSLYRNTWSIKNYLSRVIALYLQTARNTRNVNFDNHDEQELTIQDVRTTTSLLPFLKVISNTM